MGERAIQHCMKVVREHNYGRYLACLYLSPEARNAAFAIYAFDVEISRIAGLVTDPMPGEIRLQWWRDVIGGRGNGDGHRVAGALLATIRQHGSPEMIFERLIDAHLFDLYHDPMPDQTSFEGYLGETSSALLHLLCMVSLSAQEQERHELAISNACGHGGVYVGTVELLKRLGEHHHDGRQYFPAQMFSHSSFGDGDQMGDIAPWANEHRKNAITGINNLPDHCHVLFLPLAVAKLELEQMMKNGIDKSVRYQSPSRLKTWWRVNRAVRAGIN